MAPNTPGSFHTQAARTHALSILHSTECLITASLSRNESTAVTRNHYLRILYNLPAGFPEHPSANPVTCSANSPRRIAKAKGRGKARAVERVSLGADGAVPGGAGAGAGKRVMREAVWGDVLPEKFRVAPIVTVGRDSGRVSGRTGERGEIREKGKGKENVYIKREEEDDTADVVMGQLKSAGTDVALTMIRKAKQGAGAMNPSLPADEEEQDQEDGGVSLGPLSGAGPAQAERMRQTKSSPASSGKRRRQ